MSAHEPGDRDRQSAATEPSVDFGYEDIPLAEKDARVRDVFDAVAPYYDQMNDLMSAGVHRIWKQILLERLKPRANDLLLDVAGGTGDLAEGFLKMGGGETIVLDVNEQMLRAGVHRPRPRGIGREKMSWVCGDAEALPLKSCSATAYTIAFGIRNVTDRDAALREAYRILKPGGRFFCLEFSTPDVAGFDAFYDWYSFNIIPAIGEAAAGDAPSYQYLVESIRRFPPQTVFQRMMEDAGFEHTGFDKLSGGIATLYTGWRI